MDIFGWVTFMVITHLPPCHLLATLLTPLHPNYYCPFLTMLSLDPVPVTSESSGLSPPFPNPLLIHQHYPFLSAPVTNIAILLSHAPHLSLKMGFPLCCRPSHHTPTLSFCPCLSGLWSPLGFCIWNCQAPYLCSLL